MHQDNLVTYRETYDPNIQENLSRIGTQQIVYTIYYIHMCMGARVRRGVGAIVPTHFMRCS